ncbi:ABC transporter substrate-binding protein [Lysinibacillus sp. NPDC056185]|uniref:ABC transporter substrate-binding protein n=1 Tax=Lysinibacillus sp. NPDC056185 TaxID=3345739 RepID=UPI0039F0F18D
MKKYLLFIVLTLMLAACKTNEASTSEATTDTKAEETSETRIVDLSGSTEEFLKLGVTPVASGNVDMADHTQFAPLISELLKDTVNVGWYGQPASPEVVSGTAPDKIFITQRQESIKESLEKIAPVVVVPHMYYEFEERFRFIAKEVDKEEEMEAWYANYKEQAAELGDKVKAKVGANKTFMVMEATAKELRVYASAGLADLLFEDMQLKADENTPEPDGWGGKVVSLEVLSHINPDYIWMMKDNHETVIDGLDLWKNLNAVKAGNVYSIPSSQNYNESFSAFGRENLLKVIEEQMLK